MYIDSGIHDSRDHCPVGSLYMYLTVLVFTFSTISITAPQLGFEPPPLLVTWSVDSIGDSIDNRPHSPLTQQLLELRHIRLAFSRVACPAFSFASFILKYHSKVKLRFLNRRSAENSVLAHVAWAKVQEITHDNRMITIFLEIVICVYENSSLSWYFPALLPFQKISLFPKKNKD